MNANGDQPDLPLAAAAEEPKKERPGLRKYCAGCDGKLEPARAKVDIEYCRTCAPGWPTDDEASL